MSHDTQILGASIEEEGSLSLRDLLMTLWRRKLVIMGTTLIVTGFAVLTVMQIVPLYVEPDWLAFLGTIVAVRDEVVLGHGSAK